MAFAASTSFMADWLLQLSVRVKGVNALNRENVDLLSGRTLSAISGPVRLGINQWQDSQEMYSLEDPELELELLVVAEAVR